MARIACGKIYSQKGTTLLCPLGIGVFFGVKTLKQKKTKGDTMKVLKRDTAIQANYRREISLQTRIVRDKTKYSRKQKHKIRYA